MFLRILKDPLLHFLAIGLLLFVVNSTLNPSEEVDDVINVSRENLSKYVQENTNNFDDKWANAYIDSLSDEELEGLEEDYIRVEALYREALARGLDKEIRSNLVQRLVFLLKSSAMDVDDPDEKELRAYFEEHKEDFQQDTEGYDSVKYEDVANDVFDIVYSNKVSEAAEKQISDLIAQYSVRREEGL